MAANKISVQVGVDGEKEFKQSMSEIVQTSKTLASEMKLVESSFDKNASAQKKAKAQAEVLTKQIENQQKQVNLLRERYEKSVKATGENSKESLKLKESLNKAETALNKMNKELDELPKRSDKVKAAASKIGAGLKKGIVASAKAAAVGVGAVATAAAAVGKKMLDAAKDTAAAGDKIDKVSQRMGLSAEAYQKWDYVLSQSGVDINSMQTGLKTLTNQIGQASSGSEEAAERFAKLGISTKELKTLSREELFAKTIKGLQGMSDGTERAALANKLFGKSGQEITPLLNQSAKSTEELMKKAEELGFVMSNEAVKASENFQDALDTLGRTAIGLKNKLGAELLPSLAQGMTGLTDILAGNVEQGAEKINEAIADLINNVIPKLVELIQGMLPSISTALTSLLDSVLTILPQLTTTITDFLLNNLIPSIVALLPSFVSTGFEILYSLVDGISSAIPSLLPELVKVVVKLAEMIVSPANIKRLLDTALTLIQALADGINDALPVLLAAVPELINTINEGLVQNLPALIPQAVEIVLTIVEGLLNNLSIGEILDAALQLILALAKGLLNALPKIASSVAGIVPKIAEFLLRSLSAIRNVGQNLITGLWNGISDKVGWIVQKVQGFGSTVMSAIKGIFGIHSPSRVMRDEVGKNLALGIGVGFTKQIGTVSKDMQKSLRKNVNFNLPTSAMTMSASAGATSNYAYNIPAINVYAANGQSAEEIANATLNKLQREIEIKRAVWK